MQALKARWISRGVFARNFESRLTRLLGMRYGMATSSGTASLHLALLALGIGPGDEVIVPGLTFAAPANMVMAVGARPVFADIDPQTWCVDPQAVRRRISSRTRAVIVTHLYGNVADMPALTALAKKHRVALIEDAAEAIFSKCRGRYAGTWGEIGCFSFQSTKTIAMGEGGFIVSRRADIFRKIACVSDHGMQKGRKYWHEELGFNFRITDLQAAVGCGQLTRLKEILSAKKKIHAAYRKLLAGEKGITSQVFSPDADPVAWATAVKIDPVVFGCSRDGLMLRLAAAGIETRPGFYSFSRMPLYRAGRLPVAEEVGGQLIVLPLSTRLTTAEIGYICRTLRGLRKRSG